MAAHEDVVVIGGGAVGVCCADALARAGRSVLLLEGGELCSGSSWGNSGLLTTSACAPEAAPGVMGQAARWMLRRDGPFRLRPRPSPAFARWLWHFRRHCNADAARRGTAFLRDLVRDNVTLVEALARESERDFAFRRNGLVVLYATEAGLAEGRATAAALGELGIPSEELDAAGVARLEPAAGDAVVGGIVYPEDAHLDPGEFVAAVADLARARGASVREHAPVLRLHGSHRIEAVETASETIRPELVVLANGAWAPQLAHGVGLRLPIEAGKGYSLTYDAGAQVFDRPLRLWEARTVVSSMAAKVRVTAKLDLVGLDTRLRERRARRSAALAARYVSLPAGVDGARAWTGLRPLSPDGIPLIGRSRSIPNLVLATGHGHLGVSLAAVTGQAVVAIVAGVDAPFDLDPVTPERFDA